ncbi:MAG: LuxR C-terminal-related transcriptional regulator [Chloroflexota bacterium]
MPPIDGPTPAALVPPRARPSRIARDRLGDRLDAAVRRGADVVLVAAPAGSGKTVLLASWAASRAGAGERVAWLSLDASDADPGRFLVGLVAAVEHAGIGVARTRALVAGPASGVPIAPPEPAVAAASIAADLAAAGGRVVVVLDDLHLADPPGVTALVRELVAALPEGVAIAIGTRADPGIGLARLRAAGRLAEVRARDLAFTGEETARLLRDGLGLDELTTEQVLALEERTEGWAAGLQLAALSLTGRDPSATARFIGELSGSHRHLLDYLVEEVVERQPPVLREALERTSIAGRLTAGLVEALVPGTDGAAMLRDLERANLFLVALDDEGRWYRYHALFAEGLRHLLARRDPAAPRALHRTAAAWLEAAGLVEEGTEHAIAGADWERAVRLVRAQAPALVSLGEQATLERWLDALPADVLADAPGLQTDLATLRLLRGDLDGAEAAVLGAERLVASGAHVVDAAATGRMLGLGAAVATSRLESEVALARGELALAVLPASDGMARAAALGSVGRAQLQLGRLDAAERTLWDACDLASTVGTRFDLWNAEGLLAQVAAARGVSAAAEAGLQRVLAATDGLAIIPRMESALVLASLLRLAGRLDEAATWLAVGQELCARLAGGAFAVLGWLEAVRLAAARGDRAALRRALDELGPAARRLGGERVLAAAAATDAAMAPLADPVAPSPSAPGTLSARELEVLALAAAGRSNQQIADALVVTINTVKAHLHHIATKLDTPNRTATVARARELGLLP